MAPDCRGGRAFVAQKKTGLPDTRQPGRMVPRRPVRWRRGAAGECRRDHNRASTRRRHRRKSRATTDSCGFRWLTAAEACAGTGSVGQRSLVWDSHQPGCAAAIRGRGGVAFGLVRRRGRSRSRPSPTCARCGRRPAPRAPRRSPGPAGRAGASRSLPPASQSPSGPRSTPSQRRTPTAVGSGTPGLTSSTGVPARPAMSSGVDPIAPALAPRGAAEQAGGHVGAQRRRDVHRPPPSMPQHRARRRPSRRRARPRRAASCRASSATVRPSARAALRPDCRPARPARRRTGRSRSRLSTSASVAVRTSPCSQKAKIVSIR